MLLVWSFITTTVSAQVPFREIDETRIREIEKMLPEKPLAYGCSYKNREAWNKAKSKVNSDSLIKNAEVILSSEMPAWDDSLYLIFSKNGERTQGQMMIANRINRLYPLVWAECFENQGRFIPKIEETLKELISHRSWVLPAHDRNLDNFFGRKHEVELLAANFAQTLGQSLFFLDDKLDKKVRKAVVDSMFIRVFNPVLDALKTKEGRCYGWLNSLANWNAVCLSGVTAAALSVLNDKHLRARFVAIAEYYSQNYILGYTDDGYCSEGIGYFNYGFGNFVELRESIFQNTNGKLDLFADEKVKRMAMYGITFEIINGVYPAFADCHPGTVVDNNIIWYCNQNLHLGLKGYDSPEIVGSYNSMVLFPNSAKTESSPIKLSSEEKINMPIRTYFDQAGVLICRPLVQDASSMGVALKGGHNDEHHNHNDVGSFTLVVGNETLVGDPGGPTVYNGNMFLSSKRYTKYKRFSSYGHPVPFVNGTAQSIGKEAKAEPLLTHFSDTRDEYLINIRSAYPEVKDLVKLTRRYVYERAGHGTLLIEDQFGFATSGEMESAITFTGSWKLNENNHLEITGEKAKVEIGINVPANSSYSIITAEIEDGGKKFTRLGIRLNEKQKDGFIRLLFKVI